MEINLENSFFFAVKYSLSPFSSSLDTVGNKIENILLQQTQNVLRKPLISTLIVLSFILLLIFVTTIPIFIIAGVLCFVVIILIIEGFVLGILIALVATITTSILSVMVIVIGLLSSFSKKH